MSELNVYDHDFRPNEYGKFYLKSESDKVIAELKADYKEACDRLQTANLIKDEQLAATRHQKYKRCLAMARWCEMCHRELLTRACLPTKQNWNRHDEWRYFVNFWDRYEYRFRKLAEKFKEAK